MDSSIGTLVEGLEDRRMFSVVQTQGIVYIEGTSRGDTIQLTARAGGFDFSLTSGGQLVDAENVQTEGVSRVIVRGTPGKDALVADPAITVPVTFVSDAASGVTLAGGVLAVQGGRGRDVIRVYRNRGQVNDVTVVLNGEESQYSSRAVTSLLVVGNRGDDDIAIGKVGLPQLVFGGDGNDRLAGGREADWFSGDLGDDTLLGGAGDDQLFGSAEADFIDAGDGDDQITLGSGTATVLGGNGDDFLYVNIAGPKFTGGPGRDTLRTRGTLADMFLDFDAQEDTYTRLH